ncbi:hypothetical protein SASPL_155550 [Salvia splendens]|uniref:Cation-transporting P-type ATPase C-terminal domain-containing protein n=1 Tax=Salvia splendens TaxID=180675 RepID=A0A8X8VYA9_SALSN|nr:hypothetical protein SASPL_155550 [Salvia splendens]
MGVVVAVPGAYELTRRGLGDHPGLLQQCAESEGEVVDLDNAYFNHLKETIEQFANEALRTLCLAYVELEDDFDEQDSIPASGFTLIGIVGSRTLSGPDIGLAMGIAELRECTTDCSPAAMGEHDHGHAGALALATEPPNEALMEKAPVGRVATSSAIIWKAYFEIENYPNSDLILNTIIFNTFVFCQLFNELNSREMEKINVLQGILNNHVFASVVG